MVKRTVLLAANGTIVLQHGANVFVLTGFRIGAHLLLILEANCLFLPITNHFGPPRRPSLRHGGFA